MSTGQWFGNHGSNGGAGKPRTSPKSQTTLEVKHLANVSDPGHARRDYALVVVDRCHHILGRMSKAIECQGSVPTDRFLESLEWAALQLERARHVQP